MEKFCSRTLRIALFACALLACHAAWAQDHAVHFQYTTVSQWQSAFASPYSGKNSLAAARGNQETTDITLFAGMRLPDGSEIWANPEVDQGFGLSDTVGVAGYPSGEAYKVGASSPYLRLPRLFIRKTFGLGGDEVDLESTANQLGGTQTSNSVVLTIGKFSVVDIFDTNSLAHDPRSDFMNWSVIDSGAFDYAADAWGYSYGAALEWNRYDWTFRGGFFALSTAPNGTKLDYHFRQYEAVGEMERRERWMGRPGRIRLLGFFNRGNMGSYSDALALASRTGGIPDTSLVRRGSTRPGAALNIEQEISSFVGAFMKLSMNDGSREAFEFTEINRSAAAGLSFNGERWGRQGDAIGAALVRNELSGDAIAYFAAGGMGILIGDGKLNYAPERILESYYSLQAMRHLTLTLDFQYVQNPAYNRDRGPVSVYGLRIHSEY